MTGLNEQRAAAAFAIATVLSVAANAAVIVMVIKNNRSISINNVLLVNMMVAGVITTATYVPVDIQDSSLLHVYLKVTCYLQAVSLTTTIYTMLVITGHICLEMKQLATLPSSKSALLVILMEWTTTIIIFAPMLWTVVVNSRENVKVSMATCMEVCEISPEIRQYFSIFIIILIHVIPGFITVLAYALMRRQLRSKCPLFKDIEVSPSCHDRIQFIRERKRIAWILLLLIVLFNLSWLPNNIIQVLLDTGSISQITGSWLLPYARLLGCLNSAINPIVYRLMAKYSIKIPVTGYRIRMRNLRDY